MSEPKYTHPNGKGTLFVNTYKKEDNQPDLKGTGTTLDGKPIEIAAWKGQKANGETKLSLQFKEPYEKPEEGNKKKVAKNDLGF